MALNWFKNYGDLHDGVTGDTIRAAAEDPNENANVIAALASELAEDEQHVAGDVEGAIEAGTRTNPAQVQVAASELAQAGYYAVGLLKEFATSVDVFDDGVEELNTQLRHDTASAQRYAGQGAAESEEEPPSYEDSFNNVRAYLEPRYRDLDTALEDSAESVATRFEQGPTPENVKALVLAGLIPFSVAAAQWPNLNLTPQEKFEAYQAAVENGTLPAVEEMTETERQAFLAENPGLLEEWMQVEEPPEELQEVIINLALPDLDAEDADVDVQTILDGIDGNSTAEEIRSAFGNSGEVASGLALLLPWADRTGVDLGAHGRATDAQQYSEAFGRQTWEHREDIETLLTDGVPHEVEGTGAQGHTTTRTEWESLFTEAEAEELRSQWAGSYLVASNEDIGGGWDALPDDMKDAIHHDGGVMSGRPGSDFRDVAEFLMKAEEDLPAGDGLSTEMANSVAHSLYNSYGPSGPPGDQESDWNTVPGEDLLGDVLERVSLNQEATAALFHGGEVPGFDGHLPESHDPADFARSVYSYRWDDGGEAAASLTDWIPEAMENGGQDAEVATKAWYGVVNSVTATDNDGYAAFGGDNTVTTLMDGAMTYNPALANSLYETVAANLDDLAVNKPADAMVTDEDHVRLMMLLGSNPDTAQAMSASIQLHQQGIAQEYIDGNHAGTREPAGEMARLQSKLDAGLYNAARAEGLDEVEAERQRIAIITSGGDILSGAVGLANPGAGFAAGTANTLLGAALNEPDADLNAVDLPGGWADADNGFDQADLSQLAQLRANNMLLHALGGDVGEVATNPMTLDTDHDTVSIAVEDAGLDPVRLNGFNDAHYQTYKDTFDWWGPNIEVETLLNGD